VLLAHFLDVCQEEQIRQDLEERRVRKGAFDGDIIALI
jgi:hypothetical protein